jgi:hypothetical protein
MPSTSFIDGNGQLKHRSVIGAGTTEDPFVSVVSDNAGATGVGGITDIPATTPAAPGSLISLIKGFWTTFGLISEAADTTGSLMQRIRGMGDRMGSYGDIASPTGSIMGQLRYIAESRLIPKPTLGQYYASFAGGNRSYNATAGVVSVTSSGGNVCVFVNPTGSGVDLYIQRIVLSSDQPGRYERYRQGTLGTAGTAATNVNRGGNGTPGLAKLYNPAQITATGGSLGMITYVPASATSADPVDGTLILRPGQNYYWRYIPNPGVSGSSNCAVEVVWWELPLQA